MVHENQNHEDFDVKGGGRQRLRHVEGDFPSCMRKTKKTTSRRRPQSMDERKRRRQKRTTIHQW